MEELLKLIKQMEKDFAFQKQVAEKQLKEKQRIALEPGLLRQDLAGPWHRDLCCHLLYG